MLDNTVIEDANGDRKPVMVGRPRIPLLTGQCAYIEKAYTVKGMSQARIAQALDIAIPRVRRHLIDLGVYSPRASYRSSERENELTQAVQAYIDDERVVEICQTYSVNPAELYRELRARDVPFRTKQRQQHTTVQEEVRNGSPARSDDSGGEPTNNTG